jgi:glucosamine-6-phosphate deaminase
MKFKADTSMICRYGRLVVEIHPDRAALGRSAARAAANSIADTITQRGKARVIFACAPSQNEFLAELVRPLENGAAIDWRRVTVFHMDEYVGLTADRPESFRYYLQRHLLDHVPVSQFHPLLAEHVDPLRACADYSALLSEAPIDLICLGIGENGHIAFNDPPVADFQDGLLVKVVELDEACRRQQVNDGCFPCLADVPPLALTLTIPVFRQARRLSVQVPGARKADAVAASLRGPVTTACPASILRTHRAATLHLDAGSAAKIFA